MNPVSTISQTISTPPPPPPPPPPWPVTSSAFLFLYHIFDTHDTPTNTMTRPAYLYYHEKRRGAWEVSPARNGRSRIRKGSFRDEPSRSRPPRGQSRLQGKQPKSLTAAVHVYLCSLGGWTATVAEQGASVHTQKTTSSCHTDLWCGAAQQPRQMRTFESVRPSILESYPLPPLINPSNASYP